jgi:hypothetical protein
MLGVGGRISSGAQVAALPLAIALTGASQGWPCWLITLSGVLVGVVAVMTLSPWTPLLNKLPAPLGAPKASITFREIPQSDHRYPDTTVLLEVGVRPTTRLDDAQATFEFPSDVFYYHSVTNLDARGDESERGQTLPFHNAATDSPILWWTTHADLRPGSTIFVFQLVLPDTSPRKFSVTMMISSERLYRSEVRKTHEINYLAPQGVQDAERSRDAPHGQ